MAAVKCAAFIVAGFVAVDRPREGLDERYALNQGGPAMRIRIRDVNSSPPRATETERTVGTKSIPPKVRRQGGQR